MAASNGPAVKRRPQIGLDPHEQAEFLRTQSKAALATIDNAGYPHVVAMSYFVKDGAFYMTSYSKAQKVLNIRRNPKVGLMIESGGSYGELRGVLVRGTCEILEGVEAVEEAFAGMAEARGQPRRREAVSSAPKRVVLKIVPEKVFSWDHTKLGGRY